MLCIMLTADCKHNTMETIREVPKEAMVEKIVLVPAEKVIEKPPTSIIGTKTGIALLVLVAFVGYRISF